MRRVLLSLVGALVLAAPAGAAEGPVQLSIGYSFAKSFEEGWGTAPVGAFLALSGRKNFTLEFDLGWQRDSEDFLEETVTLNTITAVAGPRIGFANEGTRWSGCAPTASQASLAALGEGSPAVASISRPGTASPSDSAPTSRCSSASGRTWRLSASAWD
jgi:hypothetical protein